MVMMSDLNKMLKSRSSYVDLKSKSRASRAGQAEGRGRLGV